MALTVSKFGERQGLVTIVSAFRAIAAKVETPYSRWYREQYLLYKNECFPGGFSSSNQADVQAFLLKRNACVLAKAKAAGQLPPAKGIDPRLPAKAKEAARAEALFGAELLSDLSPKSVAIGVIAALSLWVLLN